MFNGLAAVFFFFNADGSFVQGLRCPVLRTESGIGLADGNMALRRKA